MSPLRTVGSPAVLALLVLLLTGAAGGALPASDAAAGTVDADGGSSVRSTDVFGTVVPLPGDGTDENGTATATPTPTPDRLVSTDTNLTDTNETTDQVTNTTENVTSTATNTTEETADDVTNTTEGTTDEVTNTTDDTVDDVTNTTDNVTSPVTNTTDAVTNTTDETVDGVTNATDNVTSTVTNTTQGVVDEVTNETGGAVDVVVNTTVTVGTGTPATGSTAAGSATPGGTRTATAEGDPAPAGGSPGTGEDGRPTGTATRTGAVGPAGSGRSGGFGLSNLSPTGGAVVGGAVVVSGLAMVLAWKQYVTTAVVNQSQELVWVAQAVRIRTVGMLETARMHLSRLPKVFPFGYSRHDDSDPLEHETRQALFETIEDSPGVNLSTLDEETDASLSTVRHHLRILEEEHLVASERLRGQRRYFPRNEEKPALVAALDDSATASILRTLARSGPASVSDLADDLDRDPSTISHHVSRLEEEGLIERERDGRTVVNSLAPVAERALAQDATTARRPVATD